MKSKSFYPYGSLILVGLIFFGGCVSSKSIRSFSELEEAYYRADPVHILATDSSLYTLTQFTYTESTILGRGIRVHGDETVDFDGALPFTDIIFIEQLKTNGLKAAWIVPMAVSGIFGAYQLMQASEFEIHEQGSSCPLVYAYDGSQFNMEAEAFSTSISRALETQTFHVLPSLATVDGELRVRISNERPETHLINHVGLFAVEAKNSTSVVLDVDNKVWGVNETYAPVTARGIAGVDVLNSIAEKDGRYWKSNLTNLDSNTDFTDQLELTFVLPDDQTEATLIIDAINSDLITEVYRAAGELIGDEALQFYQKLEHDAELQSYFHKWIRRSSLLVEVAGKNGWKEAGTILPEANVVPFRRAVRLHDLDDLDGEVTLRLTSMTDVWHIDAVRMDYGAVKPLIMYPLKLNSARGNDGRSVKELLAENDSSYAMVLPPNYLDLSFDAGPAKVLSNPTFIFAAAGFLYEWFPGRPDGAAPIIPAWMAGVDKAKLLKLFMSQEELFLSSLYARWRGMSAVERLPD